MGSTRREFIHNGLGFVSLGMAAPAFVAEAADAAQKPGASGKILVVLQLSGGNDMLNSLVPYADPLYYSNRPTIGIAKNEVVPLSNKAGLHPGMAALKPLFEKGKLAVVQGVGYPNPNRSHFASMDVWQTGDPNVSTPGEGWLGRYFDESGHLKKNPLAGVNFGSNLPRTLYADYGSVVSMTTPGAFQLQPIAPGERAAEVKAFTEMYGKGTMAGSYADLIRKVGMSAYTSSERIKKALSDTSGDDAELGSPQGNTLDAPPLAAMLQGGSPLRRNLLTVSRLIAADMGTRVFYVSTGGFDTHANQPNNHSRLLKDVADSLAAFLGDLEKRGRDKDVALMVFSEFGRRVKENASSGTDHGAGGLMLLAGGGIKGGFYGNYPSLEDLDRGDLKFNVDFRAVYATLLDGWLGTPSQSILKGRFAPLPLLG